MARGEKKLRPDLKFLEPVLERARGSRALREGTVRLRFSEGDEAIIRTAPGRAEVVDESRTEEEPLLEIMGDRKRIQSILEGKKEARLQFLAGGLRIRGDLRYFSDLAMELGILDEPL